MSNSPKTVRPWLEILVGVTPLLIGLLVTGGGAYFTHVYHTKQIQIGQLEALDKLRAPLLSEDPYEREFAYFSFVLLGYEQLALKLIQLKKDGAGRSVAQDIKRNGSAAAKANALATLAILPIYVALYADSNSQRKAAEIGAKYLKQDRYPATTIEAISGKAEIPTTTEVRYFNNEDKDSAESIASILKTSGLADASAIHVSQFKVKPGSIEVWIGSGSTK